MTISDNGDQTAIETEELARLRARVAELELELGEQAARANRTIAFLEDRLYWLDRWHLDLNALMEKPGASELRAGLRAVRAVVRVVRRTIRAARRLAGGSAG